MDYTPIETKNYRKPKKSKKPLIVGIACFVAGAFFGATVTSVFTGANAPYPDATTTTATNENVGIGTLPPPLTPSDHDHVFNDKYEVITPATCTSNGTVRVYCDICHEEQVQWVLATGHKEKVNPGYPATSTENGLTDGIYCETCGETIKMQEIIPAGSVDSNTIFEIKILDDTTCEITVVEHYPDHIVIPEYIDGYRVVSIGEGAFRGRTMKGVTIPNSVERIGNDAFNKCSGLESIDIPDSVGYIGSKAFNGCMNLKHVTLPAALKNIESETFRDCTSLESVKIGDSLESIGAYAFANCSSLKEIGYYAGTMEEWEKINKENGWDVDTGDYTVYCTDGNVDKNASQSSKVFSYNVISGTECEITEYHGNDTHVVIPESIDGYRVVAIGGSAFAGRENITMVTLPNSVETIGDDAFIGCHNLVNITLGEGVTSIGMNAFNACKSLESIAFPAGLKNIGESAFLGCSKLQSVTIPGSVTNIGFTAFESTGITEVTLEEGVKNIGERAFNLCQNIIKVNLPHSVESIGSDAFSDCNYLRRIYYSGTVSEWRSITKAQTWNEDTGEYIVVCTDGNADKTVVEFEYKILTDSTCEITKYIGKNFDVVIPETIDGYTVVSIGEMAFYGDLNISSVTIPATVNNIGRGAFGSCAVLTKVYISADAKITAISDEAFNKCISLMEITLPASVKSIGASAFRDCYDLTIVKFNGKLESIGEYAFADCSKITKFEYAGTADSWVNIAKAPNWDEITGSYKVQCTDGEVTKDGVVILRGDKITKTEE